MQRSRATIHQLLQLLPELEELEELRLLAAEAAVPDPDRQWARSSAFATVDRRVIDDGAMDLALERAQQSLHRHVESLFSGLRPLLAAFWAGDDAEAALRLIALGEAQEGAGRLRNARRCFEAALRLALPLADKRPQIGALRRVARVARAQGELADALLHYQRSAALARDADHLLDEIIAQTGQGNVLAMQGRFTDAEGCYLYALSRADSDPERFGLQRAQLFNNLGMILTRQDRSVEAEGWFARARAAWEVIDSPADRAICLHNHGLLRKREGRLDEARAELQNALGLPAPPGLRAAIAVDLAECCLLAGMLAEAERWGREAEEHAIASRSPYTLGHLYLGLAKLARARGDGEGMVFHEKALQLAREWRYQLLEAETLVDYALLRHDQEGTEEALSYLQHARDIFEALGDVGELERAVREMERIGGAPRVAASAD